MSEKVKLPKDVAEALEKRRERGTADSEIIRVASHFDKINYAEDRIICTWCKEGNLIRFVGALINGYEVELTPKEEAIQYLIELNKDYKRYSEHDAVSAIMQILGVK